MIDIVVKYNKACVKRQISKRPNIGFQDQISLNEGKKYCRTVQGEHSAKLLTIIKLPFVIKIFVLSVFEWQFYTGFTVLPFDQFSEFLEVETLWLFGTVTYISNIGHCLEESLPVLRYSGPSGMEGSGRKQNTPLLLMSALSETAIFKLCHLSLFLNDPFSQNI